jgi:hypothetical protein
MELNHRQMDFQSIALPTELLQRKYKEQLSKTGIEPMPTEPKSVALTVTPFRL